MKGFPALTPAQRQVREWLRHPPLEAINIVRESLGDIFAAIPGRNGGHAIIQIVVMRDCNVLQYRDDVRRRLDSIDWQWVTLSMDEVATPGKLCAAIAPIETRQLPVAYHATLKLAIPAIVAHGLLPSHPAIQQTDFPDTEGRIHFAENLMGDGSAVRWIKIFSEKYDRPQADYGILELDLRGVDGRMYQDIHSEHGLVIDRIERIDPSRIRELNESAYELEQGNGSAVPN